MNSIKTCLKICTALLAVTIFSTNLEAQQWQARHGLTTAQYQTTFTARFKQGYRLKCVSGYVSGGSERYAALRGKESGPEWQARHGLSGAGYQKTCNDLINHGFP